VSIGTSQAAMLWRLGSLFTGTLVLIALALLDGQLVLDVVMFLVLPLW
jgi:hypothetical protein